jgi:glycosyltransferase involved in cell wall biosynthesis
MTAFHHAKKTWSRAIDRYIVLTQFSKNKFIEGGLPKDRIVVKPNFVEPDPGIRSGAGNYFVFVGRLSPEKGIQTLMDAWTSLQSDVRLRIIGDGPMADAVQSFADSDQRVEWLGRQPMPEVYSQVGQATALIMPSIWYETFGRTIVESYATGTPVIASNLGAMAELVEDGKTGTLFTPGDSADLAKKVDFFANNQANLPEMRQAAREEYLSNYTAEPNYQMLTSIYEEAIASRGRPSDQHLLKC